MAGFTIVDAIALGVILLSGALAMSRGLAREGLAIAGWVAAAALAFVIAPDIAPILGQTPILGPILTESCELGVIAAFATVFAVAIIVFGAITPAIASIFRASPITGIDRGLGFLFGVARGVLLVALALFVVEIAGSSASYASIEESQSKRIFGQLVDRIEAQDPGDALDWVANRYERLVAGCRGGSSLPDLEDLPDSGSLPESGEPLLSEPPIEVDDLQ